MDCDTPKEVKDLFKELETLNINKENSVDGLINL